MGTKDIIDFQEEYPKTLLRSIMIFVRLAKKLEDDEWDGNIEHFAEQMGLNRSSVYRDLDTIETWLGRKSESWLAQEHEQAPIPLLLRKQGRSRMMLTDAGRECLKASEQLLQSLERLREQVQTTPITIRIAASNTMGQWVPHALSEVEDSRIRVTLIRANMEKSRRLIAQDKIDLALVRSTTAPSDLACEELSQDQLLLAIPTQNRHILEEHAPLKPLLHALRSKRKKKKKDLLQKFAQFPLITSTKNTFSYRRIWHALAPFSPDIRMMVRSKSIAMEAVEVGLGLCFISLFPGQEQQYIDRYHIDLLPVTPYFEKASFWAVWPKNKEVSSMRYLATQLLREKIVKEAKRQTKDLT